MITHTKTLIAISLSACLLAATASGQLQITGSTISATIDFDSDVGWDGASDMPGDNVFKYYDGYATGNTRGLIERVGWGWGGSDDQGPSADAWSWSASGFDLGMGSGLRTQFADYDNNGSLDGSLNTIPGVRFLDRGGNNWAIGIGENGGNFAPWRDYTLTLRVQNNSGATLANWEVSLDTWYGDTDDNHAVVTLGYSIDNTVFTAIDSYTTTNVGVTPTQRNLAGSISAPIANGDFLYLQFSNIRPSGGSGAGILIDNWTVAVPEPSVWALITGLNALGLVLYRRRKS